MKKLSEFANAHEELRFPEFPEDDDFADWVSELVEVDGYYMGHAITLIAGGTVRDVSDKALRELTDKIRTFDVIKGEDRSIFLDCQKYLLSLKALVDEMLQSL